MDCDFLTGSQDGEASYDDDRDESSAAAGPAEDEESTWRELQQQLLSRPPPPDQRRLLDLLDDGSAESTAAIPEFPEAGDASSEPMCAAICSRLETWKFAFTASLSLTCVLSDSILGHQYALAHT